MLLLLAGYGIYLLAGPGVLLAGGTPLGALGLVFWALAASRPGPRKKRIEFLLGGLAFTLQASWMAYVIWFSLIWLFLGYGCWTVWGGWWMKRLSKSVPLALATPAAWIGFESLLAWTPPPIGLSWLRLGHYWAEFPILAGSGRFWGVMGLGVVLASLAGLLADCVRARGFGVGRMAWGAGLLPSALAVVLAGVFPVPEMQAGPRLMLVDAAIPMNRKQSSGSAMDLFGEQFQLGAKALDELNATSQPAPDLVCWPETMFLSLLADEGLEQRVEGLQVDPWNPLGNLAREELVPTIQSLNRMEADLLKNFFGGSWDGGPHRPGLLAKGTSFLAGAEVLKELDGRLRRTNSMVLWTEGQRVGFGMKQHLAPGGEMMVGLERFEFVRDIIFEVANYVPDFMAGTKSEVMELSNKRGAPWSFGSTICFDNAFPDVYTAPLRERDMDFHLVLSNEAWYEKSQEFDQMVAFSRLHALCTGRTLVRCANAGVSCAIGPDGVELARLRVGELDRQVAGTLTVEVPVPTEQTAGERTPYIWLQPWLLPLGALLPLLLGLFLQIRQRKPLEEA